MPPYISGQVRGGIVHASLMSKWFRGHSGSSSLALPPACRIVFAQAIPAGWERGAAAAATPSLPQPALAAGREHR